MEVENEFFKTNIKFMLIDQEVVTLISKVDMEKLGLKLVQETEQKEEYSKFQAVYYADIDKTNLERIKILNKEEIEQKIKNTFLNEKQQKKLKELLNKNEDLFSNELKCAGNAIKRAHEIKLTVDRPIKVPKRRLSKTDSLKTKEIVKDMLEKQVIRRSNSLYSSPIIQKPDGTTRFCSDYKELNN